MRFLVTGESSCADGRRFGRGVATILFIRRRKPPASPWRRECEAERSGQMARTKRATMEGGRERRAIRFAFYIRPRPPVS